jgi:hypothetical protein
MSILRVKPSELARAVLTLKGKPLNLDAYAPFEAIYNSYPPNLVVKSGRQCGKSVSLAASIIGNSILRSYFSTLFISPLGSQTGRFSSTYLGPFMESPIVKKHFVSSGDTKNVFERSFNNGSRVYLSYAETEQDAGRIRGVSADLVLADEAQDISGEALPIVYETLSASEFSFKRITGTAKGTNNNLEVEWRKSNMAEWCTKCPKCNKWNIPSDIETCMKMLDNPLGPQCIHCGTVLDMKTGKWVAAKPEVKRYYGFHIPQIVVPARTGIGTTEKPGKWIEIRDKVFGSEGSMGYSAQKTANEVMGLASGEGGRILSMKEAMDCCNINKTTFDTGFPTDSRNILVTTLGVDWSVSGGSKSYTVMTVLGYDYMGKCYLLYTQRLNGVEILAQVRRAEELFHQYKCSTVGSDRGVGQLQAELFKQHLGSERVALTNYVASKTHLRWDKVGLFYAADRTMNMDTMILKAKMGISRFETPCWNLMNSYWQDALNLFEEVTNAGRRVYRKDADLTDDWLHSVVFANVAYMVVKGDFVYNDVVPTNDDNAFDIDNFT